MPHKTLTQASDGGDVDIDTRTGELVIWDAEMLGFMTVPDAEGLARRIIDFSRKQRARDRAFAQKQKARS